MSQAYFGVGNPKIRLISSVYKKGKPSYESAEDMKRHSFYIEVPRASTVVIEVANKPTIRLIRNVTFTRLDFVVSIGGIIGLFFGASILSLLEIIYIWLLRKY